jgi:hypothetical protein
MAFHPVKHLCIDFEAGTLGAVRDKALARWCSVQGTPMVYKSHTNGGFRIGRHLTPIS